MPKSLCPEVAYMVRAARALRRAGVLRARWRDDGGDRVIELELAPQPEAAAKAKVVPLPKRTRLTDEQQERLAQQRAALRQEAEVYGRIVGEF